MNLYWECCNVCRIPITKETLYVLLESYAVAVKKSKSIQEDDQC